jgi:hypothetical protein
MERRPTGGFGARGVCFDVRTADRHELCADLVLHHLRGVEQYERRLHPRHEATHVLVHREGHAGERGGSLGGVYLLREGSELRHRDELLKHVQI